MHESLTRALAANCIKAISANAIVETLVFKQGSWTQYSFELGLAFTIHVFHLRAAADVICQDDIFPLCIGFIQRPQVTSARSLEAEGL